MEIYFVRHGAAEGSLYNTPEADFERELTKYGRDTVTSGAECLKNFVPGFDLILTSPLVRAVQTAEIFARTFDCGPALRRSTALQPPCTLKDLLEEIALSGNPERVICVGHAPSLGKLATEMLTGIADENFFPLEKAGILRLDVDSPDPDQDARVVFLLHPLVFRGIELRQEKRAMPNFDRLQKAGMASTLDLRVPRPPSRGGWERPEMREFQARPQERGAKEVLQDEVSSIQSAIDSMMGDGGEDEGNQNAAFKILESFLGDGEEPEKHQQKPQMKGIDIEI